MLDRHGAAALTDFGLARGTRTRVLTKPGQVLGTLDYLAPELIEGKEATPESDVYALGCLVYECVTGAPPFADRGIFEVAVAHLEDEPARPTRASGHGERGARLVDPPALAKEPAQRPPSARSFGRMLKAAAGAR